MRKTAEDAYRSLGITAVAIDYVLSPQGVQDGIAEAARQHATALDIPVVLDPEPSRQVMEAAMRHQLPALVNGRTMLEAGGLMSFANKLDDQGQRVAIMIDKILRGAKPGDMPIEQPTTFELLINLKTAATLGVAVPQSLLLRADQVIR